MPQMRLHGSQISTRPPKQLRAAAMAKRMWMQMPHANALAEGLHHFPDAMISHPTLAPLAALGSVTDDEKRIALVTVSPLMPDVVRQDVLGDLRKAGRPFHRLPCPSLA